MSFDDQALEIHLDKDSAVKGVHDSEREVVVEDAGDDLECRVGGVFRVADIGRHDTATFVDEVMPADNRHDPQGRY